MELAKIKACICEGAAEAAIIDVLLDNDLLIFGRVRYKGIGYSERKDRKFLCRFDEQRLQPVRLPCYYRRCSYRTGACLW